MNQTDLLISIPTKDLPDGWANGVDAPEIGLIRPAPSAGFDSVYCELIFALVTGVTSGVVANWLSSKLSRASNRTVRVNGREISVDRVDELQAAIDQAMTE